MYSRPNKIRATLKIKDINKPKLYSYNNNTEDNTR